MRYFALLGPQNLMALTKEALTPARGEHLMALLTERYGAPRAKKNIDERTGKPAGFTLTWHAHHPDAKGPLFRAEITIAQQYEVPAL